MPVVPSNRPQAQQNTLPSARIQPIVSRDFSGQQISQMGRNLQGLGRDTARIALSMQDNVNQARINDAINQYKAAALELEYGKDRGYTNLNGLAALERPDGKPLTDEYMEYLGESYAGIESSLGTDEQKRRFRQWADEYNVGFKGGLLQYEAKQSINYQLSTSEGVISNAQTTIGFKWFDPDIVEGEVGRINAEVYRAGQLRGLSAEQIIANQRAATSGAHALVAMSALQNNNPAYADAYLNKYSEQMNADDLLKVSGLVTGEMNSMLGSQVGNDIASIAYEQINPSNSKRAFDVAILTESNGRQLDSNGNPLTSNKGAIGIAQVMPDTAQEVAKTLGIEFDEERYKNDPEYNYMLGKTYFDQQVKAYRGDPAKAWAAYNAGPGALNDALRKEQETGRNWLTFMPQETQNYVRINSDRYNAGRSPGRIPSKREMQEAARNDPRVINNPDAQKIAADVAGKQYDAIQQERKQREEEATTKAMQALQNNGGDYWALPIELRDTIPASKVSELIDYGYKANRLVAESNFVVYSELANDKTLAEMPQPDFYRAITELTPADQKTFINRRADLLGQRDGNPVDPSNAKSPYSLDYSIIDRHINDRLRSIGKNPGEKSNSEMVGRVKQQTYHRILGLQAQVGRKLNDAEIIRELDQLMIEDVKERWYWSDKKTPLVSMTIDDIPAEDQYAIRFALANESGIYDPTNQQIVTAYQNIFLDRREQNRIEEPIREAEARRLEEERAAQRAQRNKEVSDYLSSFSFSSINTEDAGF